MKAKILSILLTFYIYCCYAQNSFPTSNAIWNYGVSASDMFSGQNEEKNIYYNICGDTIINSNIYNKLYTTFDTIICGENLSEFIGVFRQDGQKVFFMPYYKAYSIYPAYFGQEFLLYDFDVSIGDTVFIEYGFRYYFWKKNNYPKDYHNFMDYTPMSKILTVSNVEIENGIKKITLENGWDIWYEGIGSIFGLFNAGKVQALDAYSFGFSLHCFKHNDIVKYINNPECNKCFCMGFVDIKEKKIDNETITIYPIPTSDFFTISDPKQTVSRVEIFDVFGKKVHSQLHENTVNMSSFSTFSL